MSRTTPRSPARRSGRRPRSARSGCRSARPPRSGRQEPCTRSIHTLLEYADRPFAAPPPFGQDRLPPTGEEGRRPRRRTRSSRRRLIRTRRLRVCRRRYQGGNDLDAGTGTVTIASGMHWPDDRDAGMRGRLRRSSPRRTPATPSPSSSPSTAGSSRYARRSSSPRPALSSCREARARELHAKVEQILREGSAELDVRQTELEARAAELDRREAALVEAERAASRRAVASSAPSSSAGPRSSAVRRRSSHASPSWSCRAGELADSCAPARLRSARRSPRVDAAGGAPDDDAPRASRAGDGYRLLEREGPAPEPGRRRSSSRTGATAASA